MELLDDHQLENSGVVANCRKNKTVELPFRYLGADDQAGPNYTGQPAVNSYYEPL